MSSKAKEVKTDEEKSGTSSTQTAQTQTQEQETGPWSGSAGYFDDYYKAAQDAYAKTKAYTGDFIAKGTQAQREAINMMLAAAPGLSAGAEPLKNMAMRIAGGEFLDANNPILQGGISAIVNPMQTNLLNRILPNIIDTAQAGGAYGGTGHELLKTQALDDYTRATQDLSGKMTLDWFNQRFGDIFQTPGMFEASNRLSLAPSMVTGLAGEAERGLNQLELDNALKKYENEQWANWYGVDKWGDALTKGGYTSSEGTTTGEGSSETETEQTGTSTTTQSAPDMLTQIFQGLLGALAVGSSAYTGFGFGKTATGQ